MKTKPHCTVRLLTAAFTLQLFVSAAATYTWTNFTGNMRWGTTINWSPNGSPINGLDEADFQVDVPGSQTATVGVCNATGGTLTPGITVLKLGDTNGAPGIRFSKGGATTSRLHFTNTALARIEKIGDSIDTIACGAIYIYRDLDIVVGAGSGRLTLDTGNQLQEQPNGAGFRINILGPGTLYIDNGLGHSGGMVINQATVRSAGDGRYGAVPAVLDPDNVTIGNGGTLLHNQANTVLNANRGFLLKGGGAANFATVAGNHSLTIPGPVTSDPADPAMLVVQGPGSLVLAGANTYTTDTLIAAPNVTNGGRLVVSGSISNNARLTAASGATLTFSFPSGNPTNLPIQVGAFEPTNGMRLEINGSLMTAARFPLLKYTTLGADGFAALTNNLVLSPGLFADLIDNSAEHTIDLNVTLAVNSLLWVGTNAAGGVSTTWDLGTSMSWYSLTTETNAVFSEPLPGVGDLVRFDDTAQSATVNLVGAVQPTIATVANSNLNYVFGGSGTLAGSGKLLKQFGGTLTINGSHTYSGGTSNTGGTIQIGSDGALGTGLLALNNAGTKLTSMGGAARQITNSVLVCLATSFGDPVNNGFLTFTGPFDLNGSSRNITNEAPVLITGGSSNGRITKSGSQTMTLRGAHNWNGDAEIRNGTLVVEGTVTNSGAFRPDCDITAGTAVLQVASSGVVALTNDTGNLRVGYDADTGATNIINFAGRLYFPYAIPPDGRIYIGAGCAKGIFNLQSGGIANACSVAETGSGLAEFNFDGGTLVAMTNHATFMQGLTEAYVRYGDAIIDSGPYEITVSQALLAKGSGGLLKQGTGTLILTGTNNYAGPTTVSAGTVVLSTLHRGTGSITVSDGSALGILASPDSPGMTAASLSLGSSSLSIAGLVGNPSVAPLRVTGLLTASGPVTISVSGLYLAPGQFPLIKYGSIGNAANFTSIPVVLQRGVIGTVVNNADNSSIDLVVTAVSGLKWSGSESSAWDINLTANWKLFETNTVYLDKENVLFDDTASNGVVEVTTVLAPASFVVSNSVLSYWFQGTNGIDGTCSFIKDGPGLLTMANTGANTYSGDTRIKAGTLQLGDCDIPNGAGKGNVYLDGTLDLWGLGESVNGFYGGASGVVTNSGTNSVSLGIGGNNQDSSFAGRLVDDGVTTLGLSKTGSGVATLTGTSIYSGGTVISGGKLRIGSDFALGRGAVSLSPGVLSSDSSTPRTITNALSIPVNCVVGDSAPYNGALTFSGAVDFGGGDRFITNLVPVTFSGWPTNGGLEGKYGAADLRLLNFSGNITGNAEARQGNIIYDHAALEKSGGGMRIACMDVNGVSRVILTNGSYLHIMGVNSNVRLGYDTAPVSEVTATNILDVAATIAFDVSATASQVRIGESCARGILNLLPNGLMIIRSIAPRNSPSEVNFHGGTLQPVTNNPAFMEGLSEVYMHPGGLTIDTAGFDITVNQDLLAPATGGPSGGLTKTGAGTLTINSAGNTYTNTTLVSGGILAGSGSFTGPVVVGPAGTISPGPNYLGSITINNRLTLQGTTLIEVSKDAGWDQITGISTMTYGGALVVTNLGTTPLGEGDSFQVFSATSYVGSFDYLQPPGPGLAWDPAGLATGTLRVIKGTSTVPTNIGWKVSGNTLELSWPDDHIGWILKAQTNSVSVGISSNWFTVAGSASTNRVYMPLDQTKGTVFFRLVSP